MSRLNLLIGSNGCGKTKYIYDLFLKQSRKEDGQIDFDKKFYLIVPEQDTASKQKDIMKYMKDYGSGILNIDVISFDRLFYIISDELNIDIKNKYIIMDDVKTLLIRLAIINLKNKGIKFTYFNKTINKLGFAEKLTSCFSEFYTYGIDEKILSKIINKIDNDLIKLELNELMIIQNEFLKLLKQKEFIIKEDKLNFVNEHISKINMFDNAIVAFDGFTGFIPIQSQIFSKILKSASSCYVSITYREKEFKNIDKDLKIDIFNISKQFIKDLLKIAKDTNSNVDNNIITDMSSKKYSDKNDLKFLEENLLSYNNIKFNGQVENIKIFANKDLNSEVEFLINKIIELTKFGKYTYNDIKIVVPKISDYNDIIYRKFSENNIPVFIDYKHNIYNSPLIEAVRSYLEIFATNFSSDSFLRYINSGLFDKNKNDIYFLLDNFIRKYDINDFHHFKYYLDKNKNEFNTIYDDKEYFYDEVDCNIEKIKTTYDEIVSFLIKKYKIISSNNFKNTINNYVKFVEDFLTETNIISQYNEFFSSLDTDCLDYKLLDKDIDILKRILDLLKIISVNDDEMIYIKDFIKLLDLSIENIQQTIIPFYCDQIIVGDLMRSRFDNPKVLFFLGLNDSKIPTNSKDNNIINDDLRILFKETQNIVLSQTTIETALNSRFYLYNILTNPTEKLFLSFTAKNADGEVDYKSNIISEIQNMFSNDHKFKIEMVEEDNLPIYSINYAKRKIALNNNNIKADANIDKKYILNLKYFITKKDSSNFEKTNKLISDNDIFIQNKNINQSLIKKILTDKKNISITSIENFSNCPYKYFIETTLNIKKRKVGKMRNVDLGNIFHSFMKWFFDELKIKKINLIDLDKKQIDNYINLGLDNIFSSIVTYIKNDKKFVFIQNRLKDILYITILSMINSYSYSENPFLYYNEYEKVKMKIDDTNLLLTGKIDKVEFYKSKIDDNIYVKIIDYKNSKKPIDLNVVRSGSQIQFLTYLDFCINYFKTTKEFKQFKNNNCKFIPIGSFYTQISDEINVYDDISAYNNKDNKKIKMTGIVNNNIDIFSLIDKNVQIDKKNNLISEVFDVKKNVALSTEQFDDLMKDIENIIKEKFEQIENGNINIEPNNLTNPCKYCDCNNICLINHFDKINDNDEDMYEL